jgi:hypothetical protein
MTRSCLAVAASLALSAAPAADDPLPDLLARVGAYVAQYERDFSTVLGDEIYTQQVETPEGRLTAKRRLRSEIAFVRVLDSDFWFGYRNVLEVDGRRVRDRERRLERLFAETPADVTKQARRILDEAARYNLGRMRRNFNMPLVPLLFVRTDTQPRFRFEASGVATRNGARVTRVGYREQARPTLIRALNADSPAFGTIDVRDDGAVLETSLRLVWGPHQIDIAVRYEPDASLDLLVPREMTESYTTLGRSGERVECRATYSGFRRFRTGGRIVSEPR